MYHKVYGSPWLVPLPAFSKRVVYREFEAHRSTFNNSGWRAFLDSQDHYPTQIWRCQVVGMLATRAPETPWVCALICRLPCKVQNLCTKSKSPNNSRSCAKQRSCLSIPALTRIFAYKHHPPWFLKVPTHVWIISMVLNPISPFKLISPAS